MVGREGFQDVQETEKRGAVKPKTLGRGVYGNIWAGSEKMKNTQCNALYDFSL